MCIFTPALCFKETFAQPTGFNGPCPSLGQIRPDSEAYSALAPVAFRIKKKTERRGKENTKETEATEGENVSFPPHQTGRLECR